jgi:hypothetical protein
MNAVLEAKKIESMADVEIGHILSASWGYDQTNIDYYKVIRKTAAMVEVQAIGQFYVEAQSSMSEYVMPNPENELYETYWFIPGDAYSEKKIVSEKGWELDLNQEGHKPWVWNSSYSQQVEIENAIKYRQPKISKHKANFDGNGLSIKFASYKYAYSWNGKKDFQSHWA